MAREPDYTRKAEDDHRRTYDRVMGMLKLLVVGVAIILVGLLVFVG